MIATILATLTVQTLAFTSSLEQRIDDDSLGEDLFRALDAKTKQLASENRWDSQQEIIDATTVGGTLPEYFDSRWVCLPQQHIPAEWPDEEATPSSQPLAIESPQNLQQPPILTEFSARPPAQPSRHFSSPQNQTSPTTLQMPPQPPCDPGFENLTVVSRPVGRPKRNLKPPKIVCQQPTSQPPSHSSRPPRYETIPSYWITPSGLYQYLQLDSSGMVATVQGSQPYFVTPGLFPHNPDPLALGMMAAAQSTGQPIAPVYSTQQMPVTSAAMQPVLSFFVSQQ